MMADVMALTAEDPENHGHHVHHQSTTSTATAGECSSRQQAIYSLDPSRISKERVQPFIYSTTHLSNNQLRDMEMLILDS